MFCLMIFWNMFDGILCINIFLFLVLNFIKEFFDFFFVLGLKYFEDMYDILYIYILYIYFVRYFNVIVLFLLKIFIS